MTLPKNLMESLANNIKLAREALNLSQSDLADELNITPERIELFESGHYTPSLNFIYVLIDKLGLSTIDIFPPIDPDNSGSIQLNRIPAVSQENDYLLFKFPFGIFDASYKLKGANIKEYDEILSTFIKHLNNTTNQTSEDGYKANAVAKAFAKSVSLWPHANPSDIWAFIISKMYLDPYNHTNKDLKLNLEQAWKRTSGWALERILVEHYRDELDKHDIIIAIEPKNRKDELAKQFKTNRNVDTDKIDIFLYDKNETVFGIINVKASIAERRTDDEPLSSSLISSGYYSAFWTMDCKAKPDAFPYNKGEFGQNNRPNNKRKEIENQGIFSACFSYNSNTQPTLNPLTAKSIIYCCDFNNPNDQFVQKTVEAWEKFKSSQR